MRRLVATLVGLALWPACGSDGGSGNDAPPLDCAVMQGDGSCWAQMLDSVAACAPAQELSGLLSADRTTCTYEEGVDIAFRGGAVPDDPFAAGTDFDWSFRMKVAGTTCVDWEEGVQNGWLVQQITTRAGLVRFESSPDEAALICADGTRYVTSDPSSLLKCAPSRPLSGDADSISVALGILGQHASEVPVFTCIPTAP
jgi:hypothetical protein